MKRIYIVIVIVALVGFFLLTFRGPATNEASGKLRVVTSFYPLYYFAQAIGGEHAAVTNIIPSGVEPHDHELTARDIATIEESKLLILNGGGLETWGDKIRQNVDLSRTLLLIAGEDLVTRHIVEDGESVTDPHVWLSPPLAEQMVERIGAGFSKVDPENAVYYKANVDALNTRLAAVDAEYREGLLECATKDIITSHAAFGYLAATYQLNQVSIAGLSPDAEPSPKQMADIARFAKEHKVGYIFFESLVSPKLSQTIAAEVGARTLVLDPIEGISAVDKRAGEDYFSLMKSNLNNLRTALACK